jgi:hypothetical protein
VDMHTHPRLMNFDISFRRISDTNCQTRSGPHKFRVFMGHGKIEAFKVNFKRGFLSRLWRNSESEARPNASNDMTVETSTA